MCYFLHGAINEGVHQGDYQKAVQDTLYRFETGGKNEVNASIEKGDFQYRITLNHCDCETPIGGKNPTEKQLKEFQQLLLQLKSVRGIKHIYLSKNWVNETNEKEKTVHIDDIDILNFLANLEDNCLYKIELYKKYDEYPVI